MPGGRHEAEGLAYAFLGEKMRGGVSRGSRAEAGLGAIKQVCMAALAHATRAGEGVKHWETPLRSAAEAFGKFRSPWAVSAGRADDWRGARDGAATQYWQWDVLGGATRPAQQLHAIAGESSSRPLAQLEATERRARRREWPLAARGGMSCAEWC